MNPEQIDIIPSETPRQPTKKSRKGFLVLSVVGIVVLLVVGALLWTKNRDEKDDSQSSNNTSEQVNLAAIVTITNKGFEPSTIAIKKGDSVQWTNEDVSPHQVASDPHPSHEGLKGFDSGEALSEGDSYSYTFDSAGTFTYHDHLNPLKFLGTVIVK